MESPNTMGYTPPQPGHPTPDVTASFLSPLTSARFDRDHILTGAGASLYPYVLTEVINTTTGGVAQPARWDWTVTGRGLRTFRIDLGTFQALSGAGALRDGSFNSATNDHGRLEEDTDGTAHVVSADPLTMPAVRLPITVHPVTVAPDAEADDQAAVQ